MFLLSAFNMLILILLIVYVFYRLLKTKSILTLISFTLQLSALTIVLLSIVNRVQTSNSVEIFYLAFGIVFPCLFVVYDYRSMIKKVKEKGSFEGFITVNSAVNEKIENTAEVMSVISNEAFINDTIAELSLMKEELFKGVRKKLVQAEKLYDEDNFDDAYEIYSGLVALFGSSSNLYFNYGNICFKKGMFSEAQSYYRKVLELNGQLISNLKKTSPAGDTGNETIKNIEFKQYLVYYNIAVTYLNMGKLDFALDNFEQALKINPDFNIAKEGIGRVFSRKGNKQEAVRYYEDILDKDCNNYIISFLLGKLFVELDNTDRAEECFRKCIRIAADKAEAYTELGRLLMAGKNYTEALKIFKSYVGIKEDDYNGHYNLAGCYYQTKDYGKAIAEYERAIKLNPESHFSVFNLALVYEEKGEHEIAVEYYKKAILMKIDFVDAYNNLGILFSKLQRDFEALATYANGIKACEDNYQLYYNMGVVLFELRRYEDASDAFKRAVEKKPDDTDALYYLGASLTESKKYDEAIKAYGRALNQNMSEGDIYYNIAAVYALMKKQDIAIDNLRKAININPDIKKEVYLNNVFDYMHMNPVFAELIS